jgi:hypothetical protein
LRKSLGRSDLAGNTKGPVGLAVKHHGGSRITLQITQGRSDLAGNTKGRSVSPQTTDETVNFHLKLLKMAKYMASTFFFFFFFFFFFNFRIKWATNSPCAKTHTHATLFLVIPLPPFSSFTPIPLFLSLFLQYFLACPTILCNHFFFFQKKYKEEKIHDKATSLLQTNENITGDSASTLGVVGSTGLAGGSWRRS